MLTTFDRVKRQAKHRHEWMPSEEGHYECPCGAIKSMSAEDARALWGTSAQEGQVMDVPTKDIILKAAGQVDILRLALLGYRYAGSEDPQALDAMSISASDIAETLRETAA